jgi:putative ABC transport system substrate-binding protein
MDRRAFIGVFTSGLLAAPLAARAQQTERVRRIGVLSYGEPQLREVRAGNAALEQALQGLGWVLGRTLAIEYRYWGERAEALPFLCDGLIHGGGELIVAITSPAAKAAKDATITNHIPVVFLSVNDPVALGLVQSLSHPGGNVTGLSLQFPEISSKRLQLLRELLPGVTRVAVLWNTATPQKEVELKTVLATAEGLGMSLQLLGVRGMAEIERGFDEVRAGGLIVLGDPIIFLHALKDFRSGLVTQSSARGTIRPVSYARMSASCKPGHFAFGAKLRELNANFFLLAGLANNSSRCRFVVP